MGAVVAGISAGVANANAQESFEAKELYLSLFGSYVDKSGDYLGLGAGITYYITPQIGVGAVTHVEDIGKKLIDNLAAEAYYRFPLSDVPVAPYAVAAVGHSFETEELFFRIGGGAEYQLNETWRAFGDLSWQINDDSKDGLALRLGVRLGF
jgi:hypothetical protein